jgi:hypothetical protein
MVAEPGTSVKYVTADLHTPEKEKIKGIPREKLVHSS